MYSAIPALAAIPANRIRVSQNAGNHIASIVVKKLYDLGSDVSTSDQSLERNILNAIVFAIPRGMVLTSSAAEDLHNPLDKQLEIYTYVDFSPIDPKFGTAKIKVYCRLSVMNKTLSVRTIQRNFTIEEKEPEVKYDRDQEDDGYDLPEYDYGDEPPDYE